MRLVTLCLMILLSASAVHAQTAKDLCARGKKLQDKYCPKTTPTARPTATASPKPTTVADCADGELGLVSPKYATLERVLTPDRPFKFCFTAPSDKFVSLEFHSRNRSNGVCNVYEAWYVAPSGWTAQSRDFTPGAGARYEAGKWQIIVQLEDVGKCPNPTGIALDAWYY